MTDKTKKKAKPSGNKSTNIVSESVANISHAQPKIQLYGRIAVNNAISMLNPKSPSLHFTIVITDSYSGVIGIDGQPILKSKTIKTNYYRNEFPTSAVTVVTISPPSGMTPQTFAQRLVENSASFQDGVLTYSFPDNLIGAKMGAGEYNSSSYVAGLLGSVMGYVPKLFVPGYQTPGWENPIPFHYFRKH